MTVKTAPDWAAYKAYDSDGAGHYFEHKPNPVHGQKRNELGFWCPSLGRAEAFNLFEDWVDRDDWRETLEQL